MLGYTSELSIRGFYQILENNSEQIKNADTARRIAQLIDGTTIEALTGTNERHLRGRRLDQLILFDDDRWEIEWHRYSDIEKIKWMAMNRSAVPEEFQIIKYEDIG